MILTLKLGTAVCEKMPLGAQLARLVRPRMMAMLILAMSFVVGVPQICTADAPISPSQVTIVQPSNASALNVTQSGQTTASTSTGGAINLNNTANAGVGLAVYSNQASATGYLLSARTDNTSFAPATLYATSVGTGPTMLIINHSTGGNAPAANVVSTNPNFSAMGITGQELSHGTLKVTHYGTGNDAASAGISIDLQGTGTAAQGLYINSTTSTTGKLIFVQNGTAPRLVLYPNGHLAAYGDIESFSADGSSGFVLTDRANPATKYRVYIENGQLKTEALPAGFVN